MNILIIDDDWVSYEAALPSPCGSYVLISGRLHSNWLIVANHHNWQEPLQLKHRMFFGFLL
jgi:hypothetical protein